MAINKTTLDKITELTSKQRLFLIKKGLQQPGVASRLLTNVPTAAAQVDNAIYALEEALKEAPADDLLRTAYQAIQLEYSLHFSKPDFIGNRDYGNPEKLAGYKAINSWNH